jgi:hypothetical protein
MSKEITEVQKTAYLKNGYSKCPSCKGDNIGGGFIEVDSGHCWQPCSCNDCGLTWNDIYKLVDMEVTE